MNTLPNSGPFLLGHPVYSLPTASLYDLSQTANLNFPSSQYKKYKLYKFTKIPKFQTETKRQPISFLHYTTAVFGRLKSYWRKGGALETNGKVIRQSITQLYRMFQEECARLRESVPYTKVYRYNPKHLYPKLNGYGDNGQRSLKLWQLLHTYSLPNTY